MSYCETCKHRNTTNGECHCPKIYEEGDYPGDHPGGVIDDHFVYSYSEGGTFWVGPKFGCVHHKL